MYLLGSETRADEVGVHDFRLNSLFRSFLQRETESRWLDGHIGSITLCVHVCVCICVYVIYLRWEMCKYVSLLKGRKGKRGRWMNNASTTEKEGDSGYGKRYLFHFQVIMVWIQWFKVVGKCFSVGKIKDNSDIRLPDI